MKLVLSLLAVAVFFTAKAGAEELMGDFESGVAQVALVELYTSQGCSSCPPAEALLGRLKENEALWTKIVPVAFHVDYWDGLGWPDPFASARFTQRQRHYADQQQSGRVYTPNFAVNGQEWRGFFSGEEINPDSDAEPGVLRAKIAADRIEVDFAASAATSGILTANWAVLGVDLSTAVRAGENRGRMLPQDFVALHHGVAAMERVDGTYRALGVLPIPAVDGRLALAVWVSELESSEPIQAVGGWLRGADEAGVE